MKYWKLLVLCLLLSLTGCGSRKQDIFRDLKVVESAANEVSYEEFDNDFFSMEIPEGWQVVVHPDCDLIHYTFEVYNPNDPDYLLYFGMKSEGFLSSEKERAWYASLYPKSPYAIYPAIDPQNTEGYFRAFTEAAMINGLRNGDFISPFMNDFYVIDELGSSVVGGDIVRGGFANAEGEAVEGIFTAAPKKVSLYYVDAVNVYNIIFFTAPATELINWMNVLNHCVGTIRFSDAFVEAYYAQERAFVQGSMSIANICAETSAIIAEGWQNRQTTYDIISQKQSDATLGYERVYDTESGEIYRAYNGFSAEYSDAGFQIVNEKMYLEPITGYIGQN